MDIWTYMVLMTLMVCGSFGPCLLSSLQVPTLHAAFRVAFVSEKSSSVCDFPASVFPQHSHYSDKETNALLQN
jgi:hypothetical protein